MARGGSLDDAAGEGRAGSSRFGSIGALVRGGASLRTARGGGDVGRLGGRSAIMRKGGGGDGAGDGVFGSRVRLSTNMEIGACERSSRAAGSFIG